VKQIRKRLTYANVMSSIAVFFVLAGSAAIAATVLPKNSVGKKQLKANAVTTAKIKKNAVTGKKIAKNAIRTDKIADGAVTTAKIADNAVTGAKVDEATLGTVPSAASFAGATQQLISYRANVGTAATIFSGGGLTITASCTGAAPNVGVFRASTDTNDSSIWSSGFNNGSDLDFDIGDSFDVAPTATNDAYGIVYQQGSGGTIVTADIGFREFNNTPGNSDCQAIGRVLIG
jgi:hypothetical protein